ncbi:MAG: heme-binding protein [Bacteroidetes bacterium]|nr:heme-binding protein [Bacteroidota bacterium]MDA1269412.1 heme-binding protein [Bacteroidota bacterium]
MKTIIWIAGSVLILGGVITFFSFRFKGIETPNYKVIKTLGDVEIREYPQMILAQTKLGGKRYDSNENNGFGVVANYIFGGNQQQQKIAMTAPVIMNMSDTDASMSFVMPSQYQLSELPVPNSSAVSLVSQGSMTLAVLRFGGFSSDKKIAKHAQILTQVLEKNNIRTKSSLLYMGYNAPWDVINRRNEVAFQID